jgi:hypothetical protein
MFHGPPSLGWVAGLLAKRGPVGVGVAAGGPGGLETPGSGAHTLVRTEPERVIL